ncbi:MAG TPA: hotdog domain-containing protein [Marmoricola sp.]|nr:hotdog domain-containing protein [Marmoricola sp.]
MRHVYRCPVRWSDLNAQGQIDSSTCLDYLQEARIDLLSGNRDVLGGRDVAEGLVVIRHEIDLLTPLWHRPESINVAVWVSEIKAATFTMAYEVFDDEAEKITYLRGLTVLAPFVFAEERPRRVSAAEREAMSRFSGEKVPVTRSPAGPGDAKVWQSPLKVRFSDIDSYGHVNNVKYLEFFHEARLECAQQLGLGGEDWVVARAEVDYRRPALFRHSAYVVRTWIAEIANSSVTWGADLVDPETAEVLAKGRIVTVNPQS